MEAMSIPQLIERLMKDKENNAKYAAELNSRGIYVEFRAEGVRWRKIS